MKLSWRASPIWIVGALTLVLISGEASARDPIGKSGLDAIAPLGGTLDQARRGLTGSKIDEVEAGHGYQFLTASGVTIQLCGKVSSVARNLGSTPEDALNAIMQISITAGAPRTENLEVSVVGGHGLIFSWPTISEYEINVEKIGERWDATEVSFRKGLCQSG